MEQHTKRIVAFLRRNPTLDLEVPDIAFHLKMDENFVQSTLNGLYHQGLVTARQNEYGRVYWYAAARQQQQTSEESEVVMEKREINADKLESLSDAGGFPIVKTIVALLLLVVLGAGVYLGGMYYDRRVKSMTAAAAQGLVPVKEYQPFKEQAVGQIGKLELELKALTAKIDSMKTAMAALEETVNKPKPVARVRKPTTRRR